MSTPHHNDAPDSALLRDLQAEVSTESAPLLQFIVKYGGVIAGFVIIFVVLLTGTGLWRWHTTTRNEATQTELARLCLRPVGAEQVKALTEVAKNAPDGVRFAAWLAVGQSALRAQDATTAADAFARAAKEDTGAFGLMASLNTAGALLTAGKPAEALTQLQQLRHSLPDTVNTQPLVQLEAEAANAAGQAEEAARLYLTLARKTQGLDSTYFRTRAATLAPKLVETEDTKAATATATPPPDKEQP